MNRRKFRPNCTLDWNGKSHKVEVDAEFVPAENGGRESPSWPAHYEIEDVCIGNRSIMYLLTDNMICDLAEQLMDSLNSAAEERRYDQMREERLGLW